MDATPCVAGAGPDRPCRVKVGDCPVQSLLRLAHSRGVSDDAGALAGPPASVSSAASAIRAWNDVQFPSLSSAAITNVSAGDFRVVSPRCQRVQTLLDLDFPLDGHRFKFPLGRQLGGPCFAGEVGLLEIDHVGLWVAEGPEGVSPFGQVADA